jgi:hypothetical protein
MPMLIEQMNIDELCNRAESLCQRIATRDLEGTPLYIILLLNVPAGLGDASQFDGYTLPSLDLNMKDVIGSTWKGRGPCIVVLEIMPECCFDISKINY